MHFERQCRPPSIPALSAARGSRYAAAVMRMTPARYPVRGISLVLALFALLVGVIVPPGFMPGSALGSPWVVCTGQGPMQMASPGDAHLQPATHAPHTAQKCAFADHGLNSPLPVAPAPITVAMRWSRQPDPNPSGPDLYPGLAAPPPPSHAPPVSPI